MHLTPAGGALRLVGGRRLAIGRQASQQCWGVTAGKASHNSSNVRGVTASKLGRNSSTDNQYGEWQCRQCELNCVSTLAVCKQEQIMIFRSPNQITRVMRLDQSEATLRMSLP